jgi:hypothetical protein
MGDSAKVALLAGCIAVNTLTTSAATHASMGPTKWERQNMASACTVPGEV